MPSITSSSNPPVPRIPAWKRLGLKLKSDQLSTEQNAPSPVVPHSEVETPTVKRKRIAEAEETKPTKKVKKTDKIPLANAASTPIPIAGPITPMLNRQKSVTFTLETKTEDGDSMKQLFNAWVAQQKARDPSFLANTSTRAFDASEPSHVEEQFDTTLGESERRVKRVRKANKKGPKSFKITKSPNITSIRPFLAYLREYHDSRETWKFNKNHQNHLLKHIFDVKTIPSEYAHLLYEYVRGLQGGVRTRLRDSAFAVKVKDQEDGVAGFPDSMGDKDKRQREYDTALAEYVATVTAYEVPSNMGYEEGVLLGLSDAAMGSRMVKRLRAEQILAELAQEGQGVVAETEIVTEAHGEDGDDESQKRLRMNDGSTEKLRRKRKQRTMMVDDSSSSEDSSDSESSSSDESASDGAMEVADDTSSSSSSSSESEAESDSEGESEEDGSDESDSE
jgi:hypothetical protein